MLDQLELSVLHFACILGLLFSITQDVPLVDLVFTRMPGQSYRRLLGSLLLCLCDVFRALVNSLVCSFCYLVV